MDGPVRDGLGIDGGAFNGLVDVRRKKVDIDLCVVGVDHDKGERQRRG